MRIHRHSTSKQKELCENAHTLMRLGAGKSLQMCYKYLPPDNPTRLLLDLCNAHTPKQEKQHKSFLDQLT